VLAHIEAIEAEHGIEELRIETSPAQATDLGELISESVVRRGMVVFIPQQLSTQCDF